MWAESFVTRSDVCVTPSEAVTVFTYDWTRPSCTSWTTTSTDSSRSLRSCLMLRKPSNKPVVVLNPHESCHFALLHINYSAHQWQQPAFDHRCSTVVGARRRVWATWRRDGCPTARPSVGSSSCVSAGPPCRSALCRGHTHTYVHSSPFDSTTSSSLSSTQHVLDEPLSLASYPA